LLRRWLILDWFYPIFLAAEVGVSKNITEFRSAAPGVKLFNKRVYYIPNAISFHSEDEHPAHDSRLSFEPKGYVIGSAGRLTKQKGFTYLIDSIPQVLNRYPNLDLVIMGEGELRTQLEAQVSKLGITTHVHFLGKRGDVYKILSMMDLFVLPSLWEGLPTVILESMSMGIPVIGSNISGITDLIQDGITGWLTPAGNSAALAERIINVLGDSLGRRRISQNAMTSCKNFSINIISNQYEELYHNLINTNLRSTYFPTR
jgi:glycosyltransferase involved in cell wall biosynthesis